MYLNGFAPPNYRPWRMYGLNTIQAIFRNSSGPSVMTRADGPSYSVICSTPAFNSLTKTVEAEIVDRSIFNIFPFNNDAIKQQLQAGLARALVSGDKFKTQPMRFDGLAGAEETRYWILESGPVLNDAGSADFIIHTITDIGTELLSADFFFDHHPDSVVVFDLQGNFVVANESIARMAECSVHEVLNSSFTPFISPEDAGRVAEHFEKAVRGEVQRFTTGFVSTKGKRLVIDGTLMPLRLEDDIVGVYGIGRDITSEVTAREKLKKREEQLQKILDHSLDLILTISEERVLQTVSKASAAILGYEPAEMEGRKFIDFIYEDDKEDSSVMSTELREGLHQSIISFENRWKKKDGGFAYMSWRVQWNERERTSYCVGRDITERIIAQRTLKASEERYRRLFHNNPLPMWIYERKTYRFLEVNLAAVEKYGYSEEEFLSMTILQIRPEEEVERLLTLRGTYTKYGIRYSEYWRHLKKNGELIYADVYSQAIDYKGEPCSLIIVNDATEKVKAENALRLNERRFKALVQDGSEFINILDFEGNYLYSSPSMAAFFGVDQEELIGFNGFDKVHPDDRDRVREEFETLKSVKRVRIKPYRFADSAGNWRWFESLCTNLYDDPTVNGIVLNTRDVTENIDYLTTIEKQNALFKEIAYIQSHIVRAPLARIMGLIHVIRDFPQTVNLDESLSLLFESAEELDNAIQEIVTDKVYERKISEDTSGDESSQHPA